MHPLYFLKTVDDYKNMTDKILTFNVAATDKGDIMNVTFTVVNIKTKAVIDDTTFIIIPPHRTLTDKISIASDYKWDGPVDEEEYLNTIQNLPPSSHVCRAARFLAPVPIRSHYDKMCSKHSPIVVCEESSRCLIDRLFTSANDKPVYYQMGDDEKNRQRIYR